MSGCRQLVDRGSAYRKRHSTSGFGLDKWRGHRVATPTSPPFARTCPPRAQFSQIALRNSAQSRNSARNRGTISTRSSLHKAKFRPIDHARAHRRRIVPLSYRRRHARGKSRQWFSARSPRSGTRSARSLVRIASNAAATTTMRPSRMVSARPGEGDPCPTGPRASGASTSSDVHDFSQGYSTSSKMDPSRRTSVP
jgi:hypothetical protein